MRVHVIGLVMAFAIARFVLGDNVDVPWQQDWKDEALRWISEVPADPVMEDFLRLTRYAGIKRPGNAVSQEQAEVVEAAKARILAMPNHEGYYRRALDDLREAHLKERVFYNDERLRLFNSMRQLHSPQIVELLIHLLDDDRDYKVLGEGIEILGNDTMAAGTLCFLIKNPPVAKGRFGGYIRDVPAWAEWGKGVLSGETAYEFQYGFEKNLFDPADLRKAPKGEFRSERQRPDRESPTSQSASEDRTHWGMPVAFISLIGGLSWYWLERRKKQGG